MSTRPSETVFGVSDHPGSLSEASISGISDYRVLNGGPSAGEQGGHVEWANAELHSIADTIAELQGRLERANSKLESAARVETTEFEIGRLFVEAQRFSEESLAKLETQIHEILCEAEAKATEILKEATEEAHQIRREAQQAAIASTKTAQELQKAIAGFTAVNNELVKELGALNTMLTPSSDAEMAEIDAARDSTDTD